MAQPIADETRAKIIQAIQDGGKRNEIARSFGVAPSTVSKIAKDEGITTAFDRSSIERAHAARVVDQRALRSERLEMLGQLAVDMVRRGTSSYAVIANGPDGPETVILPKPPLREVESAARAMALWVDKQVMVERHEAGAADTETAKSTLLGIVALAQEVADASRPRGGPPADGPDPLAVDR